MKHPKKKPKVEIAEPAPCRTSPLDWITYDRNGELVTITEKTPRKHVRKQLSLCARCTTQEECLEIATRFGADYGIWGGLMPHERDT